MRTLLRALAVAVLLAVLAAAAGLILAWRDVAAFRATPYGGPEEKVVVIPPGAGARTVVRALAHAGALSSETRAWRYVRWVARDPRPFRAGEYGFAGPLTPDQVLDRVREGLVKLHRLTVPEGLRADEIAELVARSGLARADDFLAAARDPGLARSLGLPYEGLEGFLFPDTYSFAAGVSARAIATEMVARFKEEYAKADAARDPRVRLGMGETAILASIVEKETGREEERPRISCVFHNRLRRGMRLQTDPTVMYATMLRTGRWSKNITKADLLTPHPYNTYTAGGLPPGPIANAGAAALRAALAPAECRDLYFVSRNDGSHVFCPDLVCHNAAVRTWQVEFFRRPR
ncbi:MAG TPA: endolytic transglycosylase MltG [Anaeromyxobacter sp.]|nr:endolytic transglycosylase MltG [Anaeromyxobacter sp.]